MAKTSCFVTGLGRKLAVMPRTFSGELTHVERPDRDPLIDLVGVHLVRWFMWMHALAIDGTAVHAYKHVATRRYLHIGADGRLFTYLPGDRYREIGRDEALADVFTGWEQTLPQPDAAALAVLEQLGRKAAS